MASTTNGTVATVSQQAAVAEGAPAHGVPAHLLPMTYKRMVAAWLEEDTPSFDYGGFVVGEGPAEARLLGKSKGILAGVPFFNEVFAQLNCTVTWHVSEGAPISPIAHVATVRGPTRAVLLGERVALNTLSRCSGIAARTASTLALVRGAGYKGALAGTRKTTPGFRLVEKYGMLVGGADPHRQDLSAMVMLKDNHIWARSDADTANVADATSQQQQPPKTGIAVPAPNALAISRAIFAARASAGFALKIEVECQSEAEAEAAVLAGADVVMLDNFAPDELKAAAASLKGRHEGKRRFLLEVSGGLTEANVRDYVCDQLDVVSTSALHQGVPHVDFSLKIVRQGGK